MSAQCGCPAKARKVPTCTGDTRSRSLEEECRDRRRIPHSNWYPGASRTPDLVDRNFWAESSNLLWVADITNMATCLLSRPPASPPTSALVNGNVIKAYRVTSLKWPWWRLPHPLHRGAQRDVRASHACGRKFAALVIASALPSATASPCQMMARQHDRQTAAVR